MAFGSILRFEGSQHGSSEVFSIKGSFNLTPVAWQQGLEQRRVLGYALSVAGSATCYSVGFTAILLLIDNQRHSHHLPTPSASTLPRAPSLIPQSLRL